MGGLPETLNHKNNEKLTRNSNKLDLGVAIPCLAGLMKEACWGRKKNILMGGLPETLNHKNNEKLTRNSNKLKLA